MSKLGPIRTCISCGKPSTKHELKRFVLVGNQVLYDQKQKLNGRGIYVHAYLSCLSKLADEKKIKRGFRLGANSETDQKRSAQKTLKGAEVGRQTLFDMQTLKVLLEEMINEQSKNELRQVNKVNRKVRL